MLGQTLLSQFSFCNKHLHAKLHDTHCQLIKTERWTRQESLSHLPEAQARGGCLRVRVYTVHSFNLTWIYVQKIHCPSSRFRHIVLSHRVISKYQSQHSNIFGTKAHVFSTLLHKLPTTIYHCYSVPPVHGCRSRKRIAFMIEHQFCARRIAQHMVLCKFHKSY